MPKQSLLSQLKDILSGMDNFETSPIPTCDYAEIQRLGENLGIYLTQANKKGTRIFNYKRFLDLKAVFNNANVEKIAKQLDTVNK